MRRSIIDISTFVVHILYKISICKLIHDFAL